MSDGEYRSCLLASIVKKTGKPFFFYFFLFYCRQNVGDEFSSVCRESLVGGALKTGEEREMNGKGG